jgi:type IV pilus assembly protein PilY1
MSTLYDPEAPGVDNVVARWDGASAFNQWAFIPDARALYTSDTLGNRVSLNGAGPRLFPLPSACMPSGAAHDLNADGACDALDGQFLQDWLFGWESRAAAIRRAWTLGGINFSTPAFIGPPTPAAWMSLAPASEQTLFQTNFATPLVNRRAQTYVGTTAGILHAFDSGLLRLGDDPCTTPFEYRGYFEHSPPPPAPCDTTRDYGVGSETFAYAPSLSLNRYLNNYTGLIPGISGPTASLDASPTVMDVDLGGLAEPWMTSATPGVGAKSVLVSSGGKQSPVVVALDVTNDPAAPAGTYPIPMFEFDMGAFAATFNAQLPSPPVALDGLGSRHAPVIGRFDVLTRSGVVRRWLAVVATDFTPAALSAGTVYFIDLTTGQPLNLDVLPAVRQAVVPLEQDEGVAGEPVPVDADANGTYDTVYVPSTSGKVWRISLLTTSLAAAAGQEILRCPVADARQTLEASGPMEPTGTQRIFSNIAVNLLRTPTTQAQIFFGTADNPDDPTDPMAPHYYALSYVDTSPGATSCSPPTLSWYQPLDPDQRVWGGVNLSQDQVFIATAVGSAADACNLDGTQNGQLYTFGQNGVLRSQVDLGGQATSTPVLVDNHLFVSRMNGGPRVLGGSQHNNATVGSAVPRSRVLLWDTAVNGKFPQ